MDASPQSIRKSCSINLGLCRNGSSLLRFAFEQFGLSVFQHKFLDDENNLKGLLLNPQVIIERWWHQRNGNNFLLAMVQQYDLIYDGMVPFLLFLPKEQLLHLQSRALMHGVKLNFVATTHNVNSIDSFVRSELHHWVLHNLEKRTKLLHSDRKMLADLLEKIFLVHSSLLESISQSLQRTALMEDVLKVLPFESVHLWPSSLSSFSWPSQEKWKHSLEMAHRLVGKPSLPIEAILITFRIDNNKCVLQRIHQLLTKIEEDRLCQYFLVIALDSDEVNSTDANDMIQSLASRPRMSAVYTLRNAPRNIQEPFPLCTIWDSMARVAWSKGADWVLLLGDDVFLGCSFHYRAIYRSFLDISERLGCPFGFGSPWLNDEEFPGFPTFPVISKVHFQIFGGLIPYHRKADFVNQDLDPYLCRLYTKFDAAPLLNDVNIRNSVGGDNCMPCRYRRTSALGWRDWVMKDISPVREYLKSHSTEIELHTVVDVVIPTYRLDIEYLQRLCSIRVPRSFETTFVVVVDNPTLLLKRYFGKVQQRCNGYDISSLDFAAKHLERDLKDHSRSENGGFGNSIRVRVNSLNSGASASRNRGLEESSAEYVLFLDDDVIPQKNLLEAYEESLLESRDSKDANSLLGMIGLVRFPRSFSMPLKHAAVLSSQLTSIFEIAESQSHRNPAWGVTANLMIKRVSSIRFDESYAKTGGGEEIDFCLHLQRKGGFFKAVEQAVVVHDYWEGSAFHLAERFSRWA